MAAPSSAGASRSTSSTCRPTRPGRCMSATAAAPCSATRSATCLQFAGYAVTREYYVNDAGAQVDALARSAYLRYREALGEDIGEIPAGLYPGDYLKPVGAGAGRGAWAFAAQPPGGALAAAGARRGGRSDAGHDQGGPRRPRHPPRRVLLRALADARQGRGGRDHRGAAPQGAGLRGAAREAQGPRRRRLGGPRADAVQVDRLRRRRRSRADEVGRQLHLLRRRHGLSPQQARARLQAPHQRVRRRPRRLPRRA